MVKAHILLRLVSEHFPIEGPQKHNFCISDSGKFTLNLFVPDDKDYGWVPVIFDPEDLEKDPSTVLSEVKALAAAVLTKAE